MEAHLSTAPAAALLEGVWSAEDTTPSAIDGALRKLLERRHAEDEGYAPARVLNFVAVVDREWRGEIANRLENVGRYHPSRTIICAVEPRRKTLDAWATTAASAQDGIHVAHERVEIDVGPSHLSHLDSIVDPLLVPDLATVAWSPHGHPEAVDALRQLADVVLLDSADEPDAAAAIARARELTEHAYVVDLSWLRSTPWRERIAASFDPPIWRSGLAEIASVTVRQRPDSLAGGLLLLGWLSCRLGWQPGSLVARGDAYHGSARAGKHEVALRLDPDEEMPVPGLAGVTVETASGLSLSLDRGPGGLVAKRRTAKGAESVWTVLGASRGEAGILGEGIRQALLRDPTYAPALACAGAMIA